MSRYLIVMLAACASPAFDETDQAVSSTPLNPSQGGTYKTNPGLTYLCSSVPGSFCFDGVTPPLATAAGAAPYLDTAASGWGCVYQPTYNAVEDLGGGNFRRFYGNQTGDPAHRQCGVAYWNAARQAAYFLSVAGTFYNGLPDGTDGHLYAKWLATPSLGYPISNPIPTSSLGVTYQLFDNGLITYAAPVGVFAAGGTFSSDKAVAMGFEADNQMSTGQPGVAFAPPPANPLVADIACASATPNTPTSCSDQRIGSWVPYKDLIGASRFGINPVTGYVLARTAWTAGVAIPAAVAPAWTHAFGAPPAGCPWCASFGFPLAPLAAYVRSLNPSADNVYAQMFEHGSITYAPACTGGTYGATVNAAGHPAYAGAQLIACPAVDVLSGCTRSEPVPFSSHANHGTYRFNCGPDGYYDGVTIDWYDGAGYHHGATVDGDIFSAWIANRPTEAGTIEDAMDGAPSSIAGAPLLGMPFEDPVCRDAACTQIDQTFDDGWVLDDSHHLSFTEDFRDRVTYRDVRAKSYHNTYEHDETLWDILTYYRVRSVEFDFRTDRLDYTTDANFQSVPHGSPNGADWFVYHYQGEASDVSTRCFRLSDCMKELKAWHDVNPYHEVITVFGDAGNNTTWHDIGLANDPAWDGTHRPLDFDDRIQRDLAGNAPDGTPILFTPGRLMQWCAHKLNAPLLQPPPTSLKDATHRCGWPSLKELRGHILWVITSKSGDFNYGVNAYLDPSANGGHVPAEMAAFGIDEWPDGDPNNSGADVVFFNYGHCDSPGCHDEVRQEDRERVRSTHDRDASMNYITRLYSNDSQTTFDLARRVTTASTPLDLAPTNFIATHQAIDQNLRTMPSPSRGYPFECIDGNDEPLASRCNTANWIETSAPAIRMLGSSCAITNACEVGHLQQVLMPASSRLVWTTGVIGDRLDHPGVYGCIEARQSTRINEAFVAICRDNRSSHTDPPGTAWMFWRTDSSGPIQSQQLFIDDGRFPGYDGFGLEQQHAVFLKLSVFRDSSLVTHALAYTSRDGVHWGCAAGNCDHWVDFPSGVSLTFQGLSMSTNDQGIFEFFFLNTVLRDFTGATTMFDPGDGTLTSARLEQAGDLPIASGNGAFGDFGNGLGAF
jgi:hypothetical protein